jgi:ribosome-associated protein
VNKVSSKVQLQWPFEASTVLPEAVRERLRERARGYITKSGQLIVTSQRSRHRQINREDCLRKLRVLILDATRRPKPRKPTKPTRASVRRRRHDKQMSSLKKRQRSAPKLES